MKRNGFTLIELSIVIALLGALAIALIIALDPLEQISKGVDATTVNIVKELGNAVTRYYVTNSQVPYSTDIQGQPLNATENTAMISFLIEKKELKNDFSLFSDDEKSRIFFNGKVDFSEMKICFMPKSESYKKSPQTIYDKYGVVTNCSQNPCYWCINFESSGEENTPSPQNQEAPFIIPPDATATPSACDGFDPEKPLYPFTCNNSSKWSAYQCTNYCVADLGCDSYCPSGQRHLKKTYYAVGSPNLETCLSHLNETAEDYCVSGIAANCSKMSYPSSSSDFLWGCSNPNRPYQWK